MSHPEQPRRRSRIAPLAALLLLGACSADPLRSGGPVSSAASLGLPTPVPLRVAATATPRLPPTPEPLTASQAVGHTVGTTLGAALDVGVQFGAGCGQFAILCLPLGAAIGGTIGLAAGTIETARSMHSEEEIGVAAAALLRHLGRERIAACLAGTLVVRSAGRLVPAAEGTVPALAIRLHTLQLGPASAATMSERDPRRSNPPLKLIFALQAAPAAADGRLLPLQPSWRWLSDDQRYFEWAARDAAALEAELGLAIGVLAQRILADLFPGAFAPPPWHGGTGREALRVACPPPTAAPSPPDAIPADG